MKKNLALVLVLALVMAVSVVAFAACGGTTYDGECSYTVSDWGNHIYGVKVKVTVNNNIITKVTIVDYDEWTRTSADANGWTSHDKAEAAYPEFLKRFEGKTVDEILAIKTTMVSGTVTATDTYTIDVDAADKAAWSIKFEGGTAPNAGATQSSARIICAVQNALSKIPAAK